MKRMYKKKLSAMNRLRLYLTKPRELRTVEKERVDRKEAAAREKDQKAKGPKERDLKGAAKEKDLKEKDPMVAMKLRKTL